MLTGQNGILNRTAEVKEQTEEAKETENIKLAFMSEKMKSSDTISQENIENELNDQQYEVLFDGEYYKIISKETQNEYVFDKYGSEKKKGKYYYVSDNLISDGNIKINVGDSINYNAIANENSKYVSSKEKNGYADQSFNIQNNVQWVILGVNNGGELLITSKDKI